MVVVHHTLEGVVRWVFSLVVARGDKPGTDCSLGLAAALLVRVFIFVLPCPALVLALLFFTCGGRGGCVRAFVRVMGFLGLFCALNQFVCLGHHEVFCYTQKRAAFVALLIF